MVRSIAGHCSENSGNTRSLPVIRSAGIDGDRIEPREKVRVEFGLPSCSTLRLEAFPATATSTRNLGSAKVNASDHTSVTSRTRRAYITRGNDAKLRQA